MRHSTPPISPAAQSTPAKAAVETPKGVPGPRGLYDPRNEHDACGVGFIANMKNVKSHQIVRDGLAMLENLTHRGAVGADPLMGDGAGLLVQIPDRFFREEMAEAGVELPPAGHYAIGHIFMSRDEAASWQRLPATYSPDFHWVNDLEFGVTDSRRIYAATRSGVWRSTDNGATWARLSEHFDSAQMMEIAFVVGTYLCLAFVLNSAGVQLDDDLDPAIAPEIPKRED